MSRYRNQYSPISTSEVTNGDALSVRTCRDFAFGINNSLAHVFNHKVFGGFFPKNWTSRTGSTDECVVWASAGRRVPEFFTYFTVRGFHKRTAGTADIVWTLYSTGWPYTGPSIVDTDWMSMTYDSITWTTSADTWAAINDQTLRVVRGSNRAGWLSYFVLTADNGDASTTGALASLDITPDFDI